MKWFKWYPPAISEARETQKARLLRIADFLENYGRDGGRVTPELQALLDIEAEFLRRLAKP